MNRPSFHSLFRRSRYEHAEELENRKAKQRRKELFAVAAVGFMLRHSRNFRRRFLRLTPLGYSLDLGENSVEIQKHDFCDLLITNRRDSIACIVEFKVDSKLMDHQHPEKRAFRQAVKESKTGYGKAAVSHLSRFRQLEYMVVASLHQFDDVLVQVDGKTIHCRSIAWGDLVKGFQTEEALETDFFDSLGELGIRAFALRNLKMKNIQTHTFGAVVIFSTVETVADELGLRGKKLKWDVGANAEACWFGVILPRRLKSFDALKRLTIQDGEFGWFGYERMKGKPPQLCVWLYSDSARRDRLAKHVLKQSGFAWKRDAEKFVHRGTPSARETDEQWFLNVLEKLKDGSRR